MSQEDYERICAELAPTMSKNKPDEYDTLTPEKKELLAYWISKAVKPASTYDANSSYGIKHDFEYQTGVYVSNAEFKGAMLIADYLPHDAFAQNWHFKITKTYDSRKISRDLRRRGYRDYQSMPHYRTQLNGEREPELQQRIAIVTGHSFHFLDDSEVEAKAELLKEAGRDRQQGEP